MVAIAIAYLRKTGRRDLLPPCTVPSQVLWLQALASLGFLIKKFFEKLTAEAAAQMPQAAD